MAPWLEISEVYDTIVNVIVHVEDYTYFRVFCRRKDNTGIAQEQPVGYQYSDFGTYFEDLDPETEYVLNIIYGTNENNCTNYAYSSDNLPSFVTASSSGGDTPDNPSVNEGLVWIEGNWYRPYICHGGSWVPAITRICYGNTWNNTGMV